MKTILKSYIKLMVCVAATTTSALCARAQSRSAFFLDNYLYTYQFNPAVGSDFHGEVAMPGLGNLNVGMMGNVGVSSFIYNTADGRTTTFLNPEISAAEVMGNINNRNRVGLDVREGIASAGFRAFGGYNHISINAVANAQVSLPGSLVSFLKEGVTNKTYDIGRVKAHAEGYAELALNHSRNIDAVEGLRVGATIKLLMGVANADVNLEQADLMLGTDTWRAVTRGTAHVSMKGFKWKYDTNDRAVQYVSGAEVDDFSPANGVGLAFDLGATYRLNPDWQFGVSLTDLGFIAWNTDSEVSTYGLREFSSSDHTLDPDDMDASWDAMKDDIFNLYQLQGVDDRGGRTRSLGATMNISAQYTLPVYRAAKFGVLNTTRMAGSLTWTDFRFSASWQPLSAIGVSVNYGVGTFGNSFGWMANFAPRGFNFFIGMDRTLGSLAKQGVPLNSNAQLSLGFNFPF